MYKPSYVREGTTTILMMSRGVLFKVHYLSRVSVNQIGSNNCVLMVSIRSIIIASSGFFVMFKCIIIIMCLLLVYIYMM